MSDEVLSAVADTATRYGSHFVKSEILIARDVAAWFQSIKRCALATAASRNACGSFRVHPQTPSLPSLTFEGQRLANYPPPSAVGFYCYSCGYEYLSNA
jgi:hypothetical protein